METKLLCTKGLVNSREELMRITYNDYYINGFDLQFLEEARGCFVTLVPDEDSDPDFMSGPRALHRSQWPLGIDDPDSEETFKKWEEALSENGDAGFEQYLSDLAKRLASPVLVLVSCFEGKFAACHAYSLQPSANVITLKAVHGN
jgi:hypothetical protein